MKRASPSNLEEARRKIYVNDIDLKLKAHYKYSNF